MHRFFFSGDCQGNELTLSGTEAHHAASVLRVQRSERVTVLDGKGTEMVGEVVEARNQAVRVKLLERRLVPPSPYRITLVQAVPKGKLFEDIVEKATELGAFRIVPLLSERVVVHLDSAQRTAKQTKWQGVAIEAIKQCGSPWLPEVERPLSIKEFIEQHQRYDLALVGALDGSARHPREHLRAYQGRTGGLPENICVWIGPEGDFSPSELETIRSAGVLPITLGPLVLRTETAAMYCLSFLNYELRAPHGALC
ncbi:MAG TPA: RsmE family RNA methyltransferase [Verrucomicrobiae bacterium]|nr:RsmE family RNA methyltransferase [Verrucomicrobiae bacterium]